MALSRLDVERFMLGGKSQKDAANYFGVTTRYIRKILATSPAVSSSPAAAAPVGLAAAADWVRLPGERGLHRVAVAPHNQEEQPAKAEQPALVPTGTMDDRPMVAAASAHNVVRVVVRSPVEVERFDMLGWLLAASVGPVPLPALLLALLLIVLCGV